MGSFTYYVINILAMKVFLYSKPYNVKVKLKLKLKVFTVSTPYNLKVKVSYHLRCGTATVCYI